ncbi:glutamate--tRNA ligase family protein [Hymenobacter sp. H14-R3]|uniref:glutamate--tRNA ligase family protein n=1 Tax=Hymenobacter sp. H14-R3 TaxID=3046308 RepID=UPI0024B89B02|nr:glutamate--tRNA ligase family protein [Hymenobacter sp. H14-R3]MDJ0366571.1 glutamate--tRNA ligase family protein [Hymenobacter sp. H14-R3]
MNLPAGKQETPNEQQITGRLAPTPSGYLHLGNAVNFVLTWLLVRQAGGTLHLRIDDLDRARLRQAYLGNIFEVINWLKVEYDYGPSGPDDFLRHHSQLLHLPAYNYALRRLALPGAAPPPGLLYGSPRSRTGGATAPVPLATPGVAWRARVPAGTTISWADGGQGAVNVSLAAEMPDFVVRKKDGVVAYQLASVVDDLRLGTTLIVRGHDLLPSTAAQLWLAGQVSDLKDFNQNTIQLFHHGLLTDATGQKLSKATQAAGETGILRHSAGPAVVYQAVARLLGLPSGAGESLATLQAALPESPTAYRRL